MQRFRKRLSISVIRMNKIAAEECLKDKTADSKMIVGNLLV